MGIQQYDGGNISNEEEYLEEEFCDLLHLGKLDRFKNLGGMNLEKFNKFISDGWNPCMLPAISENGWIGLSKFDIFSKEKLTELMQSTMYLCPFTTTDETRSFYGAIPIVILSKKKIQDIPGSLSEWYRNFSSDVSFWKPERFLEVGSITKSLNGHGYCDFTLPSDGSGEWVLVSLEIDQDTIIVFRTWDWYNK